MDRRTFLATLAGGLLAAPLGAAAQQAGRIPHIGILTGASAASTPLFDAFREGLREHGYVEGENITLDFRFAQGNAGRFPALAAELVRLNVNVIVTDGGNAAPLAASRATQTIPIVMAVAGDPIKAGLIVSLARPGGNVTGLTLLAPELVGKRLQLFKQAVPSATRVAVLWNPANTEEYLVRTETAARELGVTLHPVAVPTAKDLDSAFQTLARVRLDGLVTVPDVLYWNTRVRIVDFTARARLPAIFPEREFTDAGGLMAYGPNVPANFRRAATFVDRVLKGSKPADLPVELPTKFEFVINLKTAKALGLTIPQSVLQRADEVIQ
jgi:putative ABC transport system substrate-binding protein